MNTDDLAKESPSGNQSVSDCTECGYLTFYYSRLDLEGGKPRYCETCSESGQHAVKEDVPPEPEQDYEVLCQACGSELFDDAVNETCPRCVQGIEEEVF